MKEQSKKKKKGKKRKMVRTFLQAKAISSLKELTYYDFCRGIYFETVASPWWRTNSSQGTKMPGQVIMTTTFNSWQSKHIKIQHHENKLRTSKVLQEENHFLPLLLCYIRSIDIHKYAHIPIYWWNLAYEILRTLHSETYNFLTVLSIQKNVQLSNIHLELFYMCGTACC